jgi:hypothetical protein
MTCSMQDKHFAFYPTCHDVLPVILTKNLNILFKEEIAVRLLGIGSQGLCFVIRIFKGTRSCAILLLQRYV